jgi:hypothetical protein
MCVDCVLVSLRIAQVDPDDGPLPEVVLSLISFDPKSSVSKMQTGQNI